MHTRPLRLAIVLMLATSAWSFGATLFVDDDAPACGDGQNWATAHKYLQDALTAARNSGGAVTEIWVANGTYRPDRSCANPEGSRDRAASFSLVNGVALRGGFAGNEDPATFDLSTRDFNAHTTTLSGDLAGDDGPNWANNGENSDRVVTANGLPTLTLLDGLNVTAASANGVHAVSSQMQLSACRLLRNSGADGSGLYTSGGTLTMTGCEIAYNRGAISTSIGGNSVLVGCRIVGNAGTGVRINSGPIQLTNCAVLGNDGYGIESSVPLQMVNCTVFGNAVSAISAPPLSSHTLRNCIVWGNVGFSSAVVTHSCLQTTWAGAGNISSDPMLCADGSLRRGSPCIDAGDNNAIPAGIATDIAGSNRFIDDPETADTGLAGTPPRAVCDMGASEYSPVPARRVYVSATAAHGGDGASWSTAYRFLQDALLDPGANEIWVSAGTYRPDQSAAEPAGTGARTSIFHLSSGLRLYGGFPGQPGQEGDLAVRNPSTLRTILSGDLENNDDGRVFDTYRYQVVRTSGTPYLDGVTVTSGPHVGVLVDPGGSPQLMNCTIINNVIGLFNDRGTPALVNCTIHANGPWGNVNGIYNFPSSPSGPWASLTTVRNCIVAGNSGAQTNTGTTATYSCIPLAGIGNIDVNPRLLADGRLRRGSPCIDAADNSAFAEGQAWRFVDDPDTADSGVAGEPPRAIADMGACEYLPGPARRAYVRAAAPPGGDGASWSTAYRYLQDALHSDPYVTEIWVASGVYRPDQSSAFPNGTLARDAAFELPEGVELYGGFPGQPGQEGQLSVRDPQVHVTTLSGDLAGDDGPAFANRTDNSQNVLRAKSLSASSLFDGFRVVGGHADTAEAGGGLSSNASSVRVVGCTFADNYAKYVGGGASAFKGSLSFLRCRFVGNKTDGGGGGLYAAEDAAVLVLNCLFIANTAARCGGLSAEPGSQVINCTFSGNNASQSGGGIGTALGYLTVTNCILWGNNTQIRGYPTVTYSCVQGGWSGSGNISADPQLQPDGRLSSLSPCIDAGDNTAVPADVTTDLGGDPRFVDTPSWTDTGKPDVPPRPMVDMGAFEYQSPQPQRWYVKADAPAGGDGKSWASAFRHLQDALQSAAASPAGDIWVARGIYRPDRSASQPDGTQDRTATFRLVCGVPVYGGFPGQPGQEDDFSVRSRRLYETILSGDLAGDDGPSFAGNAENSYHVVTGANQVVGTVLLDGVTITGGNANGSAADSNGGGVYGLNAGSTLTGCTFIANAASNQGGAAWVTTSNTIIASCRFLGNNAVTGGGLYATLSTTSVRNCVFAGNTTSSTGSGGGFYGIPTTTNCTFVFNSSRVGGGVTYNRGGTLKNCILWGNTATESGPQISGSANASYSCIQGGYAGTGNISSDPLFVNLAGGDLRLRAGSPCIDAGSNAAMPAGVGIDLLGLPRYFDDPATPDCRWVPGTCGTAPIVDMGAHEFVILPGDLDDDLDVDADDLGAFILCAGGPGMPYAQGCTGADFDADLDVDSADFGPMQRCFSGTGKLANPACAE